MSRSLLRSALELRTPITRLPLSFLLPIHARRCLSTTTPKLDSTSTPNSPAADLSKAPSPPTDSTATFENTSALALYPREPQPHKALTPEAAASISQLLPLLRAQPAHYVSAHIHGRPYLVTVGDRIRLPFRMPGVLPGDVLRLDRASTLGSRDYTLQGAPYIDERLFECRATVLGVESEPLRFKVKTKRRQRRKQTVQSKHRYTILCVSELIVKGPEEVGL